MSFADKYLNRYATGQVQALPDPNKNLRLIIVIPVCNEPGLLTSLSSLLNADPPGSYWEIILVINEPVDCQREHHEQNLLTIDEVGRFKENIKREDVQIHMICPKAFSRKKAGPGMARKIGMDEAIRRFSHLNRPEGVIVSYDADTTCKVDYLTELSVFFNNNSGAGGCTLYFEHPVEGDIFEDESHRNAIIQYELYLRYFKMFLEYMGFPYVSYSLGSAFAFRAMVYVRVGGMGPQQAGEDFYFLQKCLPHGDFWELNSTDVYPSSRVSDRVVFGTGPFIDGFIKSKQVGLEVYPFEIFKLLKPLFLWIGSLERMPDSLIEVDQVIQNMPDKIRIQIKNQDWYNKIQLSYTESAALVPFVKRIYHEINLLQIIHLLNELIAEGFPKLQVGGEFVKMSKEAFSGEQEGSALELLKKARETEKSKGNIQISV